MTIPSSPGFTHLINNICHSHLTTNIVFTSSATISSIHKFEVELMASHYYVLVLNNYIDSSMMELKMSTINCIVSNGELAENV